MGKSSNPLQNHRLSAVVRQRGHVFGGVSLGRVLSAGGGVLFSQLTDPSIKLKKEKEKTQNANKSLKSHHPSCWDNRWVPLLYWRVFLQRSDCVVKIIFCTHTLNRNWVPPTFHGMIHLNQCKHLLLPPLYEVTHSLYNSVFLSIHWNIAAFGLLNLNLNPSRLALCLPSTVETVLSAVFFNDCIHQYKVSVIWNTAQLCSMQGV